MNAEVEIQPLFERTHSGFLISTDPARLDIDAIAGFLSRSYWANTRSREMIERTLAHSLCFGIYRSTEGEAHPQSRGASVGPLRQVGFARVVTDYATFAWLCDVFVTEEVRGLGLGKQFVETILAHPELQGLRRWMLATADAHELYRQFGFADLSAPDRWMERFQS